MKYAQGLIDMLDKYHHLTRVFVNAAGEWMFQPTEGFKEFSRTEILGSTSDTETTLDKKPKKK